MIAEPTALNSANQAPVGVGENSPLQIGKIHPEAVGEKSLAKNRKSAESKGLEFSPAEFSPTPDKHFSPTRRREFSPTKKPAKKGRPKPVAPSRKGQRGRPRNPDLPPTPGKYFYWSKARNGLKLERRKPEYEYIGFIMPSEWEYLRGNFDEEYILRAVIAAIRIKRARAAKGRRPGALTA
jgi:hypothetical protein